MNLTYCGNAPELDEVARAALRAKAVRNGGPDREACGHMSDEWVADRVRMLSSHDIDHEAICCAARDRIMRLVLKVLELEAQLLKASPEHQAQMKWSRDVVSNVVIPAALCEDCPPVGYPTDKTRCAPCPRRSTVTP